MKLERRRRGLITAQSGSQGWTSDGIADLTAPEGDVMLSTSAIGDHSFYGRKLICSVSGDHVTKLDNYAMQSCTGLGAIHLPNAQVTSGFSVFQGCTGLTAVHASDLRKVNQLGQTMFSGCTNLTVLVMPSVRAVGYQATHGCSKLQAVDFGKLAATGGNGIAANGFGTCAKLDTLILRRSQMIPLANINAFSGTAFKSGGAGGTLYVPQALLANYQSDAVWSILLGYENNRILPIEGSRYETEFADGTLIQEV